MEKEKKDFQTFLKGENKDLELRVKNLRLQIEYYMYSRELENILKEAEAAKKMADDDQPSMAPDDNIEFNTDIGDAPDDVMEYAEDTELTNKG